LDLELEFYPIHKLPEELFEWLFTLFKSNMQSIYEKSWGWNESQKKKELKEESARFIIAFDKSTKTPVAFTHFRFDLEEGPRLCLYCYELQLNESVRKKGLGKFMMQLLELIARKYGMQWVFLTCLKK